MFYSGKLHTCYGVVAYKIEVDAYNLHGEKSKILITIKDTSYCIPWLMT